MDEYIKRMEITKDEYLDLAADSYISYVNKQKAKEEFAKEKDLSGDVLDKEFEAYIKQEISKTLVVYYK